jgi:Uma2 family endonuclease
VVADTQELAALASPPDLYEVVDGSPVEPTAMSAYAGEVAHHIHEALFGFVVGRKLGRVRMETLFAIPQPDDSTRSRRPDVAYVSYDRWPVDRPFPYAGAVWNVVPDFACEVVSPSDCADDVIDKAMENLHGGVRLVWVVFPRAKLIYAYTGVAPLVFGADDDADGGEVLPGFRTSVRGFFPAAEHRPAS